MSALHAKASSCLAAVLLALVLAAPAAAQQRPERMHQDLVRQLRDEEVQRALIASGSLDALVGRASRRQLRTALERFRTAYGFAGNKGPLTEPEKAKLRDLYDDVRDWAGLKRRDCADPASQASVTFLLPEKQVAAQPQGNAAGKCDSEWSAKDMLLYISPQVHSLYDNTPISLFRSNIMRFPVTYTQFHVTSDEFTTKGEVANDIGGYVSYNLAFAVGNQVKALFIKYARRHPSDFDVPDFLRPLVEAETKPGDETQPDARTKGWQFLMQGLTNLIASDFPFDNGWTRTSSKDCKLTQDMDDDQPVRILFATDRLMKATAPRLGETRSGVSPDSLFAPEQDRRLRMGCAYVSPPVDGGDPVKEASKPIVDYHLFHEGKQGDFGDRLYLTDEIAPMSTSPGQRTQRTKGDALVFIHGYRVAFRDALYTVAKIVKDIKFEGRAYLYSWPSRESLTGYFEDLDNSEQAEPFFQSFMRMLMRDAHIYEIDLIAHSMGSQSMLRALAALRPIFDTERAGDEGREWRGKETSNIRVGQMIFAAPDVARVVFGQKIDRIAPYADRVTVYVSSGDLALSASKVIRGGLPRMGELSDNGEPALIDNRKVHIIDATLKQSWYQRYFGGGYGHDYLSQAKPVLEDIKDILTGKRADDTQFPHERNAKRFQQRTYTGTQDKHYWKLADPN